MRSATTHGLLAGLTATGILLVALAAGRALAADEGGDILLFDKDAFTVETLTLGDRTVSYRAYEGIVYVARPVDAAFQRMNFYVPAAYYEGSSVGPCEAETAPIFMPNMVGGYMAGPPGRPGPAWGGGPNSIIVALSMGYVVASPGARGLNLKDGGGRYTGKAPACIVDLKAAVRYLRRNDEAMPGDAEKIIANGTSAGGALSALLGATGNSEDYEPYLERIGAADERDDIFAASCYCPIIDLDNADSAYEWLYSGLNDYDFWGRRGTMGPDEVAVSDRLKALFPPYLNSLGLEAPDGTPLTLDADGEGPLKDYVASCLVASAQEALDSGTDLSGLPWAAIEDGVVTAVDLDAFVAHIGRMRPAPAFDPPGYGTPETGLFGSETLDQRHFTPFAAEMSPGAPLADPAVVRMMNPMDYIGTEGVTVARYWRIRHGTADGTTSLAIPVILAAKLRHEGCDVDFALPWARGHGGDYDLDELLAWIGRISGQDAAD